MTPETKIAMGSRLREARKAAGYTQTQLAQLLGVTHSHIGGIERGTHGSRGELVVKWADTCDVRVADMLPFGRRESYQKLVGMLPEAEFELVRTLLDLLQALPPEDMEFLQSMLRLQFTRFAVPDAVVESASEAEEERTGSVRPN